ncbi:MAG: hypothetical protein ACK5AZ_26040 [Bryobacteraceae bacterium]
MSYVLQVFVVVLGLLLWVGSVGIWRQTRQSTVLTRLALYPAILVLYAFGYFAVLVGLGIDRWDDSSAWYWDTWLLFGSTAILGAGYAITRFMGILRVFLAAMPVIGFAVLVWFYVSIP